MFHKVNSVAYISDYVLSIQFAEGVTKLYDVSILFDKIPEFLEFKSNMHLFKTVKVDHGGYGISWNDDLDLSCDELWDNGATIQTSFDNLIALSDATIIWGLNESTLRKAISYGKLIIGKDVCKYGKQWIITKEAMIREYGNPK